MRQQKKKAGREKAYLTKRRFHVLQKVEKETIIGLVIPISVRFMPCLSAARSTTG